MITVWSYICIADICHMPTPADVMTTGVGKRILSWISDTEIT